MAKILLKFLTAALLSLLPLCVQSQQSGSDYSDFIANRRVNIDELTRNDILEIFLFQIKFWQNNTKIVVVLPPYESVSFKRLAQNELKMTTVSYYETLKAKEYAGKATLLFAPNDAFVVIKVAQTPYSIGYYKDAITINNGIAVRVIRLR